MKIKYQYLAKNILLYFFLLVACQISFQSIAGDAQQKHVLKTIVYSGQHSKAVELFGKLAKDNDLSDSTLRSNAFYKCALYAQSQGKKYFVMYNSLTSAALNIPMSTPKKIGRYFSAYAVVYLLDTPRAGSHSTSEVLSKYSIKK